MQRVYVAVGRPATRGPSRLGGDAAPCLALQFPSQSVSQCGTCFDTRLACLTIKQHATTKTTTTTTTTTTTATTTITTTTTTNNQQQQQQTKTHTHTHSKSLLFYFLNFFCPFIFHFQCTVFFCYFSFFGRRRRVFLCLNHFLLLFKV